MIKNGLTAAGLSEEEAQRILEHSSADQVKKVTKNNTLAAVEAGVSSSYIYAIVNYIVKVYKIRTFLIFP